MAKNGLSLEQLLAMAQGNELNAGFRQMISVLYETADTYRKKTIEVKDKIIHLLEPRSQVSLEVIFNLYLMVFERIDIENGRFTTAELNPTADEIKERVLLTNHNFK
jgi:hypothetical protein